MSKKSAWDGAPGHYTKQHFMAGGGSQFRGTQDTFQPCFGAGMSVWESDEASQYLLLSVLAALRRDFTPDQLSSSIRTWLCCKLGSFISPDTSLFCPA